MAAPKSLGNLALEIPDGTDEKEHRRLLNERMLLISEELSKLNQPKPLEITADLDLQGHRLVNVGDPDKKINSRGVSVAVTTDTKGETQQLKNALTVEFGDARYLRRRNTAEDAGQGGSGKVARLLVTLPSVWEDDIGMYAELPDGMDGKAGDATVPVNVFEFSRFRNKFTQERRFKVGDFLLINDKNLDAKNVLAHEIVLLKRILAPVNADDPTESIKWVLQRRPDGERDEDFDLDKGAPDKPEQSFFGTKRNAHGKKTKIYKIHLKQEPFPVGNETETPTFEPAHFKNGVFTLDKFRFKPPDPEIAKLQQEIEEAIAKNTADGLNDAAKLQAQLDPLLVIDSKLITAFDIDWSHRAIAAVILQLFQSDGQVRKVTRSLVTHGNGSGDSGSRAPGLRTHSGASYTLVRSGDLFGPTVVDGVQTAPGARMRVPIHVAEWPAIRFVYGYMATAPSGGSKFGTSDIETGATVDVFFVAPPDGRPDMERDTSLIARLQWDSDLNYSYKSTERPDGKQMPTQLSWPTTDLAGVTSLKDFLEKEGGADGGQILRQDGYLDFVVRQVGGTTPGAGLCVEILL